VVNPKVRKAGRFLNPTTLILAAFCFTLPFVTVSCGTPGGYGRVAHGGSTAYTGFNLVFGDAPDVSKQPLLPPGEQTDDRLGVQPAAVIVLILVIAAFVFAIRIHDRRQRRATVATMTAVAATALLVNQALVQAEVAVRVSDHLARLARAPQDIPAGESARDYVQTGPGFGFCLVFLLILVVGNGIAWWRARPRAALVASPHDVGDQDTIRTT
jgi:hypothetical protein